jgi:hypothetical protein
LSILHPREQRERWINEVEEGKREELGGKLE